MLLLSHKSQCGFQKCLHQCRKRFQSWHVSQNHYLSRSSQSLLNVCHQCLCTVNYYGCQNIGFCSLSSHIICAWCKGKSRTHSRYAPDQRRLLVRRMLDGFSLAGNRWRHRWRSITYLCTHRENRSMVRAEGDEGWQGWAQPLMLVLNICNI